MPAGSWLAGWAVGDTVTAAEFKKSVGSIYSTTLGVAAASITSPTIPQVYANLWVVCDIKGDAVANEIDVAMRFNADVATNYDYEATTTTGTTVSATESYGQTSGLVGTVPASSPSQISGLVEILIPHYAGVTNGKTWRSWSTSKIGVAAGNMRGRRIDGFWRGTSNITQLALTLSSGNFAAGSQITVYALGA